MKRALVLTLILCSLLAADAAQAQRLPSAADQLNTLRDYASKVLPRCPGGVVTVEPVQGGGPTNFNAYVATVRTEDKYCGTQKYILHSPKTQQVLIGSVVPVERDGRLIADRLTAKTTELLGKKVKATVAPFP
ncbi:MAG TPA: hypothetical protein VFV49_10145, partial [Thermoanaerobaculia bacterium]|nr:hypothetical protein [Thermoanaerobaculia bacterium]